MPIVSSVAAHPLILTRSPSMQRSPAPLLELFNLILECIQTKSVIGRSVGRVPRLMVRVHGLMHLRRICTRTVQARLRREATSVEGVASWCLDLSAVAAVHARSRCEGMLVIVRLALAQDLWVVIGWVRTPAWARLHIAIDVAWVWLAVIFPGWKRSRPQLWRVIDDVGLVALAIVAIGF